MEFTQEQQKALNEELQTKLDKFFYTAMESFDKDLKSYDWHNF